MCGSNRALRHKEKVQGETLHLESLTMINPVTVWFEISQYDDKKERYIAKLVDTTWMSRYPIPIEITYVQGSDFIGNEFRKSLIENE